MSVTVIIPARWASSRFPGKLLADRTGKPLIQHVFDRCRTATTVDRILVATDDERIAAACDSFGASWVMTSVHHPSGTDRIAEAIESLEAVSCQDGSVVVNVQGDEPEINPGHIDLVAGLLIDDPRAQMGSLMAGFRTNEVIDNPNVVKVVVDREGRALYFSRSVIPYCRDGDEEVRYYRHLGIYAYRPQTLLRLSRLEPTPLERAERLEQLRALENGIMIRMACVDHPAEGIDTPEQYDAFVRRYQAAMAS